MRPCHTAPIGTVHVGLPTPGHPVAPWPEDTPPPAPSPLPREKLPARRVCGPEEDGVDRASHWRGRLEETIEEEEEIIFSQSDEVFGKTEKKKAQAFFRHWKPIFFSFWPQND